MTGKLIVLEGLDSTGKATQAQLLIRRLKKQNIPSETLDFPQYGNWSAVFVEKYLNGEFGTSVDPHTASLFYALDRYAAAKKIKEWLEEDKIIIANRYVSANQAYQGSKIPNATDREQFLAWLDHVEHTILGLPRPTLILYLDIPLSISQELLEHRRQKEYIKEGNKDIHEKDHALLQATEQVYKYISQSKNWRVVACTENNSILSKEQIHEKIWDEIKGLL
jgi:dTMP kinase